MKRTTLVGAILALLLLGLPAAAQTTLPLNTGYNYNTFAPYPAVSSNPSTVQDQYWINIASYYPPGATWTVAPSFVVATAGGWAAPLPGTRWINGRNTNASSAGASQNDPSYTLFRKCFCLLPGFRDASLNFRLRADNTVQVWFNTQTNQLLAPVVGLWAGPGVRSGGTNQGFRVGRNCLYVLVEDFGTVMGFDLLGDVTATGLLPTAAAGVQQSFAPCACNQAGPTVTDQSNVPRSDVRAAGEDDDREVVQAIIKIAEARRLERVRQRQ